MTWKALVAEDKPALLENICQTIDADPRFEVVAGLQNVDDCFDYITNSAKLDVLFLDIKLYNGTCFHLLQRLRDIHYAIPPVIIISGGNERDYVHETLNTFRREVISFIEKPFNVSWKHRSEDCHRRIADFHGVDLSSAAPIDPQEDIAPVRFLEAFNGQREEILPASRIAYVALCEKGPDAYRPGVHYFTDLRREPYYARVQVMTKLEKLLGDVDYVRGNRDLIVRLDAVRAIEKQLHGSGYEAIIRLPQEPRVALSKDGYKRLRSALGLDGRS